jgi:hypothetical protein
MPRLASSHSSSASVLHPRFALEAFAVYFQHRSGAIHPLLPVVPNGLYVLSRIESCSCVR